MDAQSFDKDNSIFIGTKPFMNYVTGVVIQFTTKNATQVHIKARGKFIARAVDVAEIARKRFLKGQIEIKDIAINSEEFQNKDGKDVHVSTIDIVLQKI
ncbi:MAG: DNA-binding protein Alba [Candidatus Nanoarchaeia archaeon]